MTLPVTGPRDPIWANDEQARFLKRRLETFWNEDYLAGIVLPLLAIPLDGRVLDVGSGYGVFSLLLARLCPAATVIGLDREPQTVVTAGATAAELSIANATFQEGDAHQLPFADATFDTVVCQTVLTHVADAAAVVREMARVLRPGGTFLAVEYSTNGGCNGFNAATAALRDEAWYTDWFRLVRLHTAGKQRLGRGDDSIGVQVPWLAQAAGLRVLDIRLNDRVWHALPPYRKVSEQVALEGTRDWVAQDETEPEMRAWAAANIEAGGGTAADVDRYFALMEGPHRAAIRAALAADEYAYLIGPVLYLTFADKPAAG